MALPFTRGALAVHVRAAALRHGSAATLRSAAALPLQFAWPTTGRRIVERYGERRNATTGTVTINPGINIAAAPGSTVTASESGTVSAVSWMPSYGTVVIIQHRQGYRTVYGKLSAASVGKGAGVRRGDRVGTVGGKALHFEMWCGTTRLDPTRVLRR